jgi:hypothetical protein
MLDEAAITTHPVDEGNLRTLLQLIVQPLRHSIFPCMRPKFSALYHVR